MPQTAIDPIQYDTLVQNERVHRSLYTDPHIFTDELEKIFYHGWVFIAHESEIPQPGDFITRQVGTQSVILVRGTDHTVSALLNRCAHRGTTVCPAERGHARTFTCPYHGWSYDLSGALQGVPYPAGYGGSFDKKAHGLTCVPRLESYRGFVFVSLSPSGISLADHLGTAAQLIDRACDLSPEGVIKLSAGWIKHRYPSNWKMLPENDTDGYHLGFVHRSILKAVGSQYRRFVGEEKSIKSRPARLGEGSHGNRFCARLPTAVRVVRRRLGGSGRALSGGHGAQLWQRGNPAPSFRRPAARLYFSQPLFGRDEHRHHAARQR